MTTRTVNNNSDNGADTLRQCIADSIDGDTIEFNFSGDTTIYLNSELLVEKTITIEGPNNYTITIDAQNNSRIFNVNNSIDSSISNLKLINGAKSNSRGGGINCSNSTVTVINSTISECSAKNFGGGISCYESTITIINSTISECSVKSYGGGIYCTDSTMTIINSTINECNANTYCGGIYCTNLEAEIINCTFSENFSKNGNHLYLSSVLGNNKSTKSGNTIYYNSNHIGSDIFVALNSTFTSLGHNIIGSTYAQGSVVTDPSDLLNPHTNNFEIGPLGNYGGPTQTMELLKPESNYAIAAGDTNLLAQYNITTDQRGFPRTTNGFVDIGAFQFQESNRFSSNSLVLLVILLIFWQLSCFN